MRPSRAFTLSLRLSNGSLSANISSSIALRRRPTHQLFAVTAVLAVMILSLHMVPFTPVILYAAALISSSLLDWVTCWQAPNAEVSVRGVEPLHLNQLAFEGRTHRLRRWPLSPQQDERIGAILPLVFRTYQDFFPHEDADSSGESRECCQSNRTRLS